MKKYVLIATLGLMASVMYANDAATAAKKFFDLKGSNDVYSKATMTIIDSNKNQKVREFELFERNNGDTSDTFVRFLAPADVKDTKFLTIGSKTGSDDQRIYLPALKKTRKISSSDKTGKFVGSDLFYYDMESKEFEDFAYKMLNDNAELKESQFKTMSFYVIEQVSKDAESPYSKSITYQNKADNFIYKTEAFDKNGTLWKTMYMLSTKVIDGVIIPTDTLVVNNIEGTKTRIQVGDVKLNTGLNSAIFTIQNLEK